MLNKNFKRMSATILLAFFALIFHADNAFGQNCDNFPVTTCNIPASFQTWIVNDSTSTSTGQTGEPIMLAGNILNSRWLAWTAAVNADYILDTRNTNPGGAANLNTMIAIYTGGSTFGSLTQLRFNDDWNAPAPNGCSGVVPLGTEESTSSCATFTSVAGTTYYIQFDGFANQVGNYQLNLRIQPSSAEVSISGRIMDAKGNPLSRVRVNLTKSGGEIVSAVTNSFGYYHFDGLGAGQTYILEAQSKKYRFQNNPRVLSVSDDVQDENFMIETNSYFKLE